ncbi:DUF2269 domain-containing protein [bacterium]|nr:DUF2269 domain-containing protein [bacterium]
MMYPLFKLIHIIAVILFMGNITVGVLWAGMANRSGKRDLLLFTFKGIRRSDMIFTNPAVLVILLTGFGAAGIGGYKILGSGWILWSIILFTVSGILYMAWVAPLQKKIVKLFESDPEGDSPPDEYSTLYKKWVITSHIALLTPWIALVLMVLKPILPAF